MIVYSTKLTPQPTTEPVSIAEAKAHLRIDSASTGDDAYINALVMAAREIAERYRKVCGKVGGTIASYGKVLASYPHVKIRGQRYIRGYAMI